MTVRNAHQALELTITTDSIADIGLHFDCYDWPHKILSIRGVEGCKVFCFYGFSLSGIVGSEAGIFSP